ncbi:MAG: hypothetical protein A2161_12640 [Candidatus Schekmanbacteria bacterium RBG_13_48_7]|uniref:Fibronectin type-III domain-containing protein n=1 Tax=Candidatus Schekmanbacteria bacterium RBG_13_48_7 TaxID=1817878 RepID=A0A1F7S3N0_9BACT|nr:MAG: hypothetical protein A2161_12640 [Candidatus Schekmanbacteria bacterium RBG_13_48_7]
MNKKILFIAVYACMIIPFLYSCEESTGISDAIPPDFSGEFYPTAHQEISSLQPSLSVLNFKDFNGKSLKYDFQLFNDKSWKQLIDQGTDIQEGTEYTQWKINIQLQFGVRYYWRVRAKTEYSEGNWEVQSDFRVKNIFPPTLYSPIDGETMDSLTPLLCVTDSTGISGQRYYDFEVYADESLTQLKAQKQGQPEISGKTCWQVNVALSTNSHYYWRARCRIAGEQSDWSDPEYFYICACQPAGGNGYAQSVVLSDIDDCDGMNRFMNPNEALGTPNATGTTTSNFRGFVSLGLGGSITLDMKVCIRNGAGYDIRVYQYVSNEPVEVYVSSCRDGTYYSLGTEPCNHPACGFDISGIPLNEVRYIKIVDRSPTVPCYEHIGADIDAVQAIYYH